MYRTYVLPLQLKLIVSIQLSSPLPVSISEFSWIKVTVTKYYYLPGWETWRLSGVPPWQQQCPEQKTPYYIYSRTQRCKVTLRPEFRIRDVLIPIRIRILLFSSTKHKFFSNVPVHLHQSSKFKYNKILWSDKTADIKVFHNFFAFSWKDPGPNPGRIPINNYRSETGRPQKGLFLWIRVQNAG